MRRFLKIIAWLSAGLVLALATLPWWMGGLLALVKEPLGLELGRYERLGYTRFALHDLRYKTPWIVASVGRVEADAPLIWGWRHLRGNKAGVSVKNWQVEIKGGNTTPPDPDAGWTSLQRLLSNAAVTLDRWLPEARLETGEVVFPGGKIGLKCADWRAQTLQVDGLVWAGRSVQGVVKFRPAENLISLQLVAADSVLRLNIECRGQNIAGTAWFHEQPLGVVAEFGERGWFPVEAHAVADGWRLDGARLKLEAAYTVLLGSGRIDWRKDSFVIDLRAKGEPVKGEAIPPLELEAKGHGNLDTVTIEKLHLTMPGIEGVLSEPLRLNRAGQLLSGPSRLAVTVDLARQPWFTAEGRVAGEARIETGRDFKPRVDVRLGAQALKVGRWTLPSIQAAGVFDWPLVDISNLKVVFGPEENVQLSGGTNLQTKEIRAAKLEARLKGTTVASLWPGVPVFGDSQIAVSFEGPWKKLQHAGEAQVTGLDLAPLRPVAIKASWAGTGEVIDRLQADVAKGEARISFKGMADRNGVRVDALCIGKADTTWLALEKSAQVVWQPTLRCDALTLAGAAGRVELAARIEPKGEARLLTKDLTTLWLRDWLAWRGPDWRIAVFDFSGRWDNGPMDFSLAATLGTVLAAEHPIDIQVKAAGGSEGAKLESLQVFEGQQEAIVAKGALPLAILPASETRWKFDPGAPLHLDVVTRPEAEFWKLLAEATGLTIARPELNLQVSGSWQDPHGTIEFKSPKLAASPKRFKRKMPVAEAVDGHVELDRKQIVLRKLTVIVDGQQVGIEAQLPVPADRLGDWDNFPWKKYLHGVSGRVQIPGADLAALAAYAPDLVAPKGLLAVDVTFTGGEAHGYVRVEHAASRPLGPLGVLQELKADLLLRGRGLDVRLLEGKMGGQPVVIKGSAELADDGTPRFDLSMKGENLPFVRQVGLLLRGDLDLKVASTEGRLGKISGKVNLRDSLFSSDVRDLVPKGGGGSASSRPPFFSIEPEPFNAWLLDVELIGTRFMRLRTPVFNGLASMRFRLGNTLAEPRAIGQVTIDEGQIPLPFATFTVRQGYVRLTEANPYEPELFMFGTTRRIGYDLRMEMSGTASAPVLSFSSSPSLDSEEVLMMVMAGKAPNNEVSYTGTQRATQFGSFLGMSLLGSLSSDDGSFDRLSVVSGEKISRQSRETYSVEYRLDERWSLVGEYDEFDEYNAGLKWRVLTGKCKEAKPDAK